MTMGIGDCPAACGCAIEGGVRLSTMRMPGPPGHLGHSVHSRRQTGTRRHVHALNLKAQLQCSTVLHPQDVRFLPQTNPHFKPMCSVSTGREPSEAKAKAREDPTDPRPPTRAASTLKHIWHVHGLVQPGTEIRVVPACCYIVDTSGAWKSAQEALSSCGQSKPGCTYAMRIKGTRRSFTRQDMVVAIS